MQATPTLVHMPFGGGDFNFGPGLGIIINFDLDKDGTGDKAYVYSDELVDCSRDMTTALELCNSFNSDLIVGRFFIDGDNMMMVDAFAPIDDETCSRVLLRVVNMIAAAIDDNWYVISSFAGN